LNDGKQPILWSYHFTVLFWPLLLGLYTLAYIDCACFKIKSNDSLLRCQASALLNVHVSLYFSLDGQMNMSQVSSYTGKNPQTTNQESKTN